MNMLWLEHQLRTYPKKDRPVINWTCSACTFINRSYLDECEICDTKQVCTTKHVCTTKQVCTTNQVVIKDTNNIDGRQDAS